MKKNLLLAIFTLCSATIIAQNTVIVGANNGANTTTDYPCPIQDWYYASRAQYLYSGSELSITGITPGSIITEIGWVVNSTAISGHLIEDYSISLLSTPVPALSDAAWEVGVTPVYGPQNYSYASGYGGNVTFQITPFVFTGGNLLVEVCGGISSGGYTNNPMCAWTTGLPFQASHQWRQDVAIGCGNPGLVNYANPNNRPVLVVTFIPSGLELPTLEGDVYYDLNQNGVRDMGENGLANRLVFLNPLSYYGLTDINGHYKFYLDTATYAVNWVPIIPWTLTSSPSVYSVSLPPNSTGNDFGIYAPPSLVEYTQNVSYYTHAMRCNYEGFSHIEICNTGLYPENGSITLIHSSNLPIDSAQCTAGFSVSGDTVRWSYSNLMPGGCLTFIGNFHNGAAGDTVSYTYIDSVFDASGNFQNGYSNSFTFIVTCSVDPNDKLVDPAGEGISHYTLMADELQYTIHFQNTGNDTAFNVVILDTLDASLDVSTLQVLGSSHPMTTQIAPGGVLRFAFNDILLPDSNANEPGSNGYLIYSIKAQTGLMDGTVIENEGHIIFDFNAPVVTNTTYNTMVYTIPTGLDEPSLASNGMIFPNPFSKQATILFNGSEEKSYRCSVYNSIGENILSEDFKGKQYLLNKKFGAGFYILRISDASGVPVYSTELIRE